MPDSVPVILPETYRLYKLAEEIRNESRETVRSICLIGRRLKEAQEILKGEGTWVAWLKEEFEWSHQTAYNFINAANLAQRHPDLLKGEYTLSALYLLAGASDDEVQTVLAQVEEGGKLTKGKALRVIRQQRWKEAMEILVEADPGAAYHEIEFKMQEEYYHEAAVELFKKYEEQFAVLASEDKSTLEIDVGMTIEERYPVEDHSPIDMPPQCQLEETGDACKVIVWVVGEANGESKPYTIATFPRHLPPAALAWRNAAMLAVVNKFKIRLWEERL